MIIALFKITWLTIQNRGDLNGIEEKKNHRNTETSRHLW